MAQADPEWARQVFLVREDMGSAWALVRRLQVQETEGTPAVGSLLTSLEEDPDQAAVEGLAAGTNSLLSATD